MQVVRVRKNFRSRTNPVRQYILASVAGYHRSGLRSCEAVQTETDSNHRMIALIAPPRGSETTPEEQRQVWADFAEIRS